MRVLVSAGTGTNAQPQIHMRKGKEIISVVTAETPRSGHIHENLRRYQPELIENKVVGRTAITANSPALILNARCGAH